MQQSSLQGYIRVLLPNPFSFQQIDRTFEKYITELFPRNDLVTHTAHLLICRILHLVTAFLRQNKIAVSNFFFINPENRSININDNEKTFFVVLPVVDPIATKETLVSLIRCVELLINESSEQALGRIDSELNILQGRIRRYALPSQNRIYIALAAMEMDIPLELLRREFISLGTGCKNIWLNSLISNSTSSIGVSITKNKLQTSMVLKRNGLPTAVNYRVTNEKEAASLAEKTGFPVVVKPTDRDQGRGVSADLESAQAVEEAFRRASKYSANVMLEKHIEGVGHRFTVCNQQVVKITRKLPAGVTGDGEKTIRQLVTEKNNIPKKRRLAAQLPPKLELDGEAIGLMSQRELTADSIPAEGEFISLRRKNNATTGGDTVRLKDSEVHVDNIELAIQAANALRLDLAGVDIISPDISKSWMEVKAAICEVNAQPQTDMKTMTRILASLTDLENRIPAYLLIFPGIISMHNAWKHACVQANMLNCNGLSSASGVWIDQKKVGDFEANSFASAKALLTKMDVLAAYCVMEETAVLSAGLPLDYFDAIYYLTVEEKTIPELLYRMVKPHADQIVMMTRSP